MTCIELLVLQKKNIARRFNSLVPNKKILVLFKNTKIFFLFWCSDFHGTNGSPSLPICICYYFGPKNVLMRDSSKL